MEVESPAVELEAALGELELVLWSRLPSEEVEAAFQRLLFVSE